MPWPFSRSRPKDRPFRLFFATDVHGSQVVFRKFVAAARFYGVDALVLGGDICGKLLIPIIRERGDSYRVTLHGTRQRIDTQEELQRVQQLIEDLGFYWVVVDEDRLAELQADPEHRERVFQECARRRLAQWLELVADRLRGTGVRCYVTGGNDDTPEVLAVLDELAPDDVVVPCEDRVVYLGDRYPMVSSGLSNPTPWRTPREVPEDELELRLTSLLQQVPDHTDCVCNVHVPPVDSTLDSCPLLDTSTDPPTPVVRAGQPVMFGAGSKAVRSVLERYQPLLSLHGHIHESRGAVRIGRTLAVNPGSQYGEGVLYGVIVALQPGKVASFQMTSG